MIIIHRKRIAFILIVIIISVIDFCINMNAGDSIQTVSLPITGKTIVLDAGHGNPDFGAESTNGIKEANLNLLITQKVQLLLEQSGCNVILTRSDENGIYNAELRTVREKKVSDIKNRVKIGNESSADAFISIHLNKILQSQYFGWQSFFKENNKESEELARSIQQGLNTSIQRANKREALKITGKYIIEHVEIPITIIECGFLSNPEEEQLLKSEEYQDRLAWGIYNGIMDYFYK